MDRKMIDYYPEYLREYEEIQVISRVQQLVMEQFWKDVESMWNNQYTGSLDENGCHRWEVMLGIRNKDTYSLKDRRNKIAILMADQRPYTLQNLKNRLTSICGKDGYEIDIDYANYQIVVSVSLGAKNRIEDVRKMLLEMIPANMASDTKLLYNTYETLSEFTYEQLSQFTYEQLRSDVLQ